jgi:hypothetical protein
MGAAAASVVRPRLPGATAQLHAPKESRGGGGATSAGGASLLEQRTEERREGAQGRGRGEGSRE